MKNAKLDWSVVIDAAFEAGRTAGDAYIKRAMPPTCGWAYVVITPARGACVAELKARKIGNRSHPGWAVDNLEIYRPKDKWYWQSVDLANHVCKAFAEVLEENGVEVFVHERLD